MKCGWNKCDFLKTTKNTPKLMTDYAENLVR